MLALDLPHLKHAAKENLCLTKLYQTGRASSAADMTLREDASLN